MTREEIAGLRSLMEEFLLIETDQRGKAAQLLAAANQSHECAVLLRRHIQEREDELDDAEDEGS